MNSVHQEDGINGLGNGVINVNSNEFKFLQNLIQQKSEELSEEEKLNNSLFAIKLRMYAYLNEENKEVVEAGVFLNELIKSANIRKKIFANYIKTKEPNLSALLSGNRRINPDLAIKLGKIFGLDPVIWMNIQTKNDIAKIETQNEKEYKFYSLNDLFELEKRL